MQLVEETFDCQVTIIHFLLDMTGHPDLQFLKSHPQQIHDSISYWLHSHPSSTHILKPRMNQTRKVSGWSKRTSQGLSYSNFLDDPSCANLPPLSTNAPCLIAVWNKFLCAPAPILSISIKPSWSTSLQGAPRMLHERKTLSLQSKYMSLPIMCAAGSESIRESYLFYQRSDLIIDTHSNSAKNFRLLSEVWEIDSHLTDSRVWVR